VVYTPSSFRWPMLICTAAWSFDVMSLLVQELQQMDTPTSQHCINVCCQSLSWLSRMQLV